MEDNLVHDYGYSRNIADLDRSVISGLYQPFPYSRNINLQTNVGEIRFGYEELATYQTNIETIAKIITIEYIVLTLTFQTATHNWELFATTDISGTNGTEMYYEQNNKKIRLIDSPGMNSNTDILTFDRNSIFLQDNSPVKNNIIQNTINFVSPKRKAGIILRKDDKYVFNNTTDMRADALPTTRWRARIRGEAYIIM